MMTDSRRVEFSWSPSMGTNDREDQDPNFADGQGVESEQKAEEALRRARLHCLRVVFSRCTGNKRPRN